MLTTFAARELTHSQQVASLAGVHRGDHRSKLVDLAIVPIIKIIWSIQPSSWSRSGVGHNSRCDHRKVLSPAQIEYAGRRRHSMTPNNQDPRS
jgi:hypothetical protein